MQWRLKDHYIDGRQQLSISYADQRLTFEADENGYFETDSFFQPLTIFATLTHMENR